MANEAEIEIERIGRVLILQQQTVPDTEERRLRPSMLNSWGARCSGSEIPGLETKSSASSVFGKRRLE